MTKKGREIF